MASKSLKQIQEELSIIKAEKDALNAQLGTLNNIFKTKEKFALLDEQQKVRQEEINLLQEEYLSLIKNDADENSNKMELKRKEIQELKNINKQEEKNIKLQKEKNTLLKHYSIELSKIFSLQSGWIKSLNDSDKIIRQTILSLGMSGKKADSVRTSFEKSAIAVTQMGGSLADIQSVMNGYADETGRARALTDEMLTDIIAIGRGTGLGVEAATKLGAQFELMGFDAKRTMEYAQGIVDTSERMGVNTTKVFKNINDNFKRLQQYSFQTGVKGMGQMAMYAEKMKIDMNQALNAVDAAKNLEKAIDLAASLQVMGGEFAKADPFELLFLSRNDPAKYTEKINQMTKGVVTFRKMADGSFEKFISPADRDRIANVEKSLGMQAGELTTQALRMADIQKMRQNMLGAGLSSSEKELIEGMAIYNKETGGFVVQVAGVAKNISDMTGAEAKSFITQQATLKQRAKDSLTFEEALQATLASLKSVLLPMLRGFNDVMKWIIPKLEWVVNGLHDLFSSKFLKIVGAITAGAILFGIAATSILKAAFILTGSNLGGIGGRAAGVGGLGKTGGKIGGGKIGGAPLSSGGRIAGRNAGTGMMRGGAGIGAAALGIGAGIGAAAAGISLLADSMSKLTDKQAENLNKIVKSLAWFMGIGVGLAVVVTAFGAAATAAAGGLLAFGAAALLIGAGIGVAALGIGKMGEGLATLVTASSGAGKSMLSLGAGITLMAAGMTMFTGGALGLAVFAGTMAVIAKRADAVAKVGESFKQINAVMSGSKEDFLVVERTINAISGMNTKGGSVFADLANLMKSPLKVEFVDKSLILRNNITLDIDGQTFMNKTFDMQAFLRKYDAARSGQEGVRG